MKFACCQWPCDASEDRPRLVLKSHTVLLTYQGDWGLLELGPDLPPNPTTGQLTAYVQGLPEAEALWTAFSSYAHDLAADLHAPSYACCLEICLKTFEQEKLLRLHAHVYMRNEVQEVRSEHQARLRFKHSDAHLKDTLWGKKTARSNWAGAYYCLAPKLGSLYQRGSVERFKDFPVDPSWVFNLVEAEKMAYWEAKTELIRCGKGLVRRLADLECWHQNRQNLLVHDMVKSAQAASREQLQKFHNWPVANEWLASVMKPMQPRKKVLVLNGPSRTGKTEFARGLFPLGEVHELNCAGLAHICLDGFDCLKHRCILWDEGAASLVSRNRKVFQHPLCQVDLGHSPTGQHVRRYFLGNSCSIVTTNKWHEDVAELPAGDQEWLASNTVVLEIDQPMWEDPDQLTRCVQKFKALQL